MWTDGDAGAGGDGAGEVEGVDGADADELALLLDAADLAEGLDGLGAGVLLAVEAGDEAAAADEPRASMRRRARRMSRQGTVMFSRWTRSRKTTP